MTTTAYSVDPVATLNPFGNSNFFVTASAPVAPKGTVVGSTAELLSALKNAKAGDTILLKSGTYSGVNIANLKFDGKVTITSQNPADKAVFTDLHIRDSANIGLSNVELTAKADAPIHVFKVTGSTDVALDRLKVTGASHEHEPLMIRSTTNVSFTNSEVTNAFNALNILSNVNLSVTDNLFHNIRADGVRGNAISDLTIARNLFTNFHPRGDLSGPGDHPDAIQIWTEMTSASASNIVIDSNVFVRGEGRQIQGIFVHDNSGSKPFLNLSITDNLIAGGLFNGIYFTGRDVNVTGNKVVGFADQLSWIRGHTVVGGTVSNNEATRYEWGPITDVKRSNNNLVSSNSLTAEDVTSRLSLNQDLGSLASSLLLSSLGLIGLIGGATGNAGQGGAPSPSPVEPNPEDVAPQPIELAPVIELHKQFGTSSADRIVSSGKGNDEMHGGLGNDVYVVRHQSDMIVEHENGGKDAVYSDVSYRLGDNVEELYLRKDNLVGHGNDLDNRIVGWDGHDVLYGHGGNDLMQGGKGNDVLYGGDGNDDLRGEDGDDILYGESGNDLLSGGAGNDTLYGGDGDDILEGGAGNDILWGGAGADQFRFRSDFEADGSTVDIIADYSRAENDKINLTLIDANTNTATNDVFRFIGQAGFSKSAGELRTQEISGSTYVYGDVDGDGVADFTIVMQNVVDVTARDFWL